jgi:hypothetical protein
MTDETANLVLEHLKRFQAQMSRFEDRLADVASDMHVLKQHMAAFMQSELRQDSDLASIKLRLDRIERRLELVE